MRARLALVVVCFVVLAGCANPFAPADTASPETDGAPTEGTPGATTTSQPTASTDETVSFEIAELPPGVSRNGIENTSVLFAAHAESLERTGFVAVGNGTGVIQRSGFLLEVESEQRNRVGVNGSAYEVSRDVAAGPVGRQVDAWSNGSTEYKRTIEGGSTNYTTGPARTTERLAGNSLLSPYLLGGNYTLNETRDRNALNESGGPSVVLVSNDIGNETVLRRALTDDVEEVTSYEAVLVVDATGRIQSLEATIEYVIGGREATHRLDFSVQHVDEVTVSRPDWVDEARSSLDESA